jgi:hypothetical protein
MEIKNVGFIGVGINNIYAVPTLHLFNRVARDQ